MPLLSKRIFNCVKPLTNVGSNEKVFTIPHTSEQFRSQDEYDKRVQLYKKRIWTCQSTGHVNLTHEEAWSSEKTVLKTLKEQFSPCYDKPVLELVHHSTKSLDCLVDQAWLMLQQTLVVGERVLLKVKSGSKSMKAVVVKVDRAGVDANPTSNCSSPSSDKENSEKDDNTGKKWVPPKLLPYKYSIRFENEDSVIHSVPAGDLSRGDKPPSKELLRLFIRTYAVRAGQTPNSPWIVDEVQSKKLDLPNKFANFLLSPVKWRNDEVAKKIDEEVKSYRSPSKASPRIKTKMDAKEEKRKEKAKKSIIKMKEKGERAKAKESSKKSEVVVLSDSDDSEDEGKVVNGKDSVEQDSDSDTPLSVVRSQLSPKKKKSSPEKGKSKVSSKKPLTLADLKKKLEKKKLKKELKTKDKGSKKDKEKKKSKKGQDPKQLTLLDLAKKDKDKEKGLKTPEKKSPQKPRTPQRTPGSGRKKAFGSPSIPPIILKLQKAIKKEDKNLIRFCCTQAAKVLNSAQRERLPENVKDMVMKKFEAMQEKKKLSRMTEEEKKDYLAKQAAAKRAKKNAQRMAAKKKLNEKLKELRKIYEDTKLELKDLPAPKLVPTPDNIPNEDFGDIIMITEFIANYAGLLMPDDEYPIYTGALMKALSSGKDGFTYLCRVVTVLLQTLLQDQIAEDYQDLEVALSEIPVNPCTCSELVRLCLRRRDTSDDRSSNASEEEEELDEDEVPEELIQLLETQELYQLEPDQKIQILKGLCLRVMGTYSVQDYMEEKQQEATTLWKQKFAMLKDKKKNKEKPGKEEKGDDKKPAVKEEKKEDDKGVKEEPSNMLLTHFYGNKKDDDVKSESGDVKTEDKKKDTDKDSLKSGETSAVNDKDVVSLVKRRRMTAAQAAEEKRQKEIENKIRREKEEEILKEQKFIKQFSDGINLAKLSLRQVPIGTDRFHSRYWVFSDVTPGLYVEKGWVGEEMNYSCCPDKSVEDEDLSDAVSDDDDAQDDENAITAAKKNKPNVVKKCIDTTFPHEGQNLWFVYESVKDVDNLIETLHIQGARESRLKKELKKRYSEIKNAILKYQRSKKELRDCDGDKEMQGSLKKEVLETETRLRNGGLGGVEDFPAWSIRLETAEELSPVADCLLETQENVLEKFRDGIMVVKKKKKKEGDDAEEDDEPVVHEMATGIIYWRDAVKNAGTYSRLHVMLGMLDSCIKWEKSAENAKCKICRKKCAEDKLLLCDACNQAFHMFCLRPALLDVPQGDWHCPACAPQRKRVREIRGRYAEDTYSDSDEDEDNGKRKKKKKEKGLVHDEVCFECRGDEELVQCAECPSAYHLECHDPPLRHPPRGRWVCNDCKNGVSRRNKSKQAHGRRARAANKRKRYTEQDSNEDEEDEREATPASKRQCTSKRKAASKPTDSDKNGEDDWSPDSKQNSESKTRPGRGRPRGRKTEEVEEPSDEESEMETSDEESDQEAEKKPKKAAAPRKSKSSPKAAGRPKKRKSEPVEEVIYDSKPKASRRAPSELSVMEDIINKMLDFKDAWPFYNNVCKKDVPDYYTIIKTPISFQKIKDRLNCLVYGSPQEVLDAVALLFRNGVEYNKVGSEVFDLLEISEKHFVELLSKKLPQYVYSRDVVANGYSDHMYTDDGRRSRRSK